MKYWKQRTIKDTVTCTGVGLHSGVPVTMRLRPAPADSGVVFRRVDLPGQPEIPARVDMVVDTFLNTSLGCQGAKVMTVEHLLAALAGCGVDNAVIELDGPEAPVMDGSSGPFVLMLKQAGLKEQEPPRQVIRVKRTIRVADGDRIMEVRPSELAKVTASIEFPHPLLDGQSITLAMDPATFDREISRARTFGFLSDVEKLRRAGLARGGSLDNAIVVDRFQVLNPSGLRFDNEFVRHKILDIMGDLSLMGRPIVGHVIAHKTGHQLNHLLMRAMLTKPQQWETVSLAPAADRDGEALAETSLGAAPVASGGLVA